MKLIFVDINKNKFFPFALIRPISFLRVGIDTLREKWFRIFKNQAEFFGDLTDDYLQGKFLYKANSKEEFLLVNPQLIPTEELIQDLLKIESDIAFFEEDIFLFVKTTIERFNNRRFRKERIKDLKKILIIKDRNDIFLKNGEVLTKDFNELVRNKSSQDISKNNTVIGKQLFVESGAKVVGAIINATNPVYISKNSEIMEGAMIRGPFYLGDYSLVKMGAKIYGPTTIGAHCKVGGELSNVIFQDYSNKAHDGFIGNSVVGSWCNFGADSNVSNLKNNYSDIKTYDFQKKKFTNTGLQYCGLMFGDHSKCAINTSFNTGTVVGIFSNIFCNGFPDKYVASFDWGGKGQERFELKKIHELADQVMSRREIDYTKSDKEILEHLYYQLRGL